MPTLVRRLAIFGPGLLGGSLAGAVRRAGLADDIHVWARRAEAAQKVVSRGWADLGTCDVRTAAEGADLVVLATPVGAMPELARQLIKVELADTVLVTDVGSVKGYVEEKVAPIFNAAGIAFIGSHPMAGAETAGFEAARDDLFEGTACVLTLHAASVPRLREFWQRLGCRLSILTPLEHDMAVARISHLPHLAASATALAALAGDPGRAQIGGRGFRDTTRVASGDPGLWTEILIENRAALEAPLADLISRLGEVLDFLRRSDQEQLRHFLAEAKRLRDQTTEPQSHG